MTQASRSIEIAVCTFRRPQLSDTLASLAQLDRPADMSVTVIVADNDHQPTARETVEAVAAATSMPVRYLHCPAANISIARNACLDASQADLVAFIDDDEVAPRDWLVQLLRTLDSEDADVVLGPVRAIYDADAPDWMQRGDFHSTFPVVRPDGIRTGYTCNVLMNMASHALRGRRFDLERGQTGGEDTHFFDGAVRSGGKIAFAPHAWLEEAVPPSRSTFKWLARRRFRVGQTHAALLRESGGSMQRVKHLALAGAKVLYCAVASLPVVAMPVARNRTILRGIMHFGVICGLLGAKELRLYGTAAAASA